MIYEKVAYIMKKTGTLLVHLVTYFMAREYLKIISHF